jgi:hypothetical protein
VSIPPSREGPLYLRKRTFSGAHAPQTVLFQSIRNKNEGIGAE